MIESNNENAGAKQLLQETGPGVTFYDWMNTLDSAFTLESWRESLYL